jgi:serine/threonine protein kinase
LTNSELRCTELEYEKGDFIGFGYSAQVYRGKLNKIDVAVKDYAPERFYYTAKAALFEQKFSERPWFLTHLAKCFDEQDNIIRVFQTLAQGHNLVQWAEQGRRWKSDEKHRIASQIARLMDEMHDVGIKMDDVHPRQFVVDKESLRVTMVDFDGFTDDLSFCRTWDYPDPESVAFYVMFAPPEARCAPENSCSEMTSVYMLGQLMWYLDNGEPLPVDGSFHCEKGDDTSATYCRVMQECLSERPEDRPSLSEVIERLACFSKHDRPLSQSLGSASQACDDL